MFSVSSVLFTLSFADDTSVFICGKLSMNIEYWIMNRVKHQGMFLSIRCIWMLKSICMFFSLRKCVLYQIILYIRKKAFSDYPLPDSYESLSMIVYVGLITSSTSKIKCRKLLSFSMPQIWFRKMKHCSYIQLFQLPVHYMLYQIRGVAAIKMMSVLWLQKCAVRLITSFFI